MKKVALIGSAALFLLIAVLLFGCGSLQYYLQSANGQMEILSKRQPISELLADPATEPELKKRLRLALDIREFAASELGLPDNESYRAYADLKRPYVVWNVVATPEFSLEPVTWCYPIVGCLPYRGYYHEADAEKYAADLRRQGMDTVTYGVAAYSTLKWFADPILNTFSNYSEEYLAGLIFHELAHQQVYLAGQADFNEAYAETVQRAGVERWFQHQGDEEKAARARSMLAIKREFIDMALETRSRLQELYASGRDASEMRARKQLLLESFQEQLSRFRTRHRLTTGFDKWLRPDLNNALFASVSTYHDLGPAFEQLLQLKNGNMAAFHREVARIADLGEQERDKVLAYLANLSVAARNPSAPAAPQEE